MMNNNLISIIVPCYKVEKYLSVCVNSLICQTYQNTEIILVDDGSPDSCGQLCDEFACRDSRIKVIHKKNGGLADARNVAIDVAAGEWITFVDSDDYVSMDYIEILYGLVSRNRCLIGVSDFCCFVEDEYPHIKKSEIWEKCLDQREALCMMFYQEKMETTAWGKIYHRSLFETGIRFPFGLIYEDLPTTYRLFLKSDRIAVTNKETYFYLIRKDSLEGQVFNPKKFRSGLEILHMFLDDWNSLKNIEDAARCRLFSFCLHILLEMPINYDDSRKIELEKFVKENRLKVLLNSKARKKARVAALLSFFGNRLMRKALSIVKQRS